MKKFTIAAAVLSAFLLVGASTKDADAAGFSIRFGAPGLYGGYGHGHVHGYGHGYGYGVGHGPSFYRGGYWHDTSHYDYVPPRLERHYNHYHYVPGGYIYHRDGRWHH